MSSPKLFYFLSKDNLKLSDIDVQHVLQKLDPSISLVIGGTGSTPIVSPTLVQFTNVFDYGTFLARSHKLLKNDRTLVRSLQGLAVATAVNLSAKSKELFGDPDINVSDVLQVLAEFHQHSKGQIEFSEKANDIIDEEKSSNLINPFLVLEALAKASDSIKDDTKDQKVLFIYESDWFSNLEKTHHKKMFETIFDSTNSVLKQVQIEVPLDASFHESKDFEISTSSIESIDKIDISTEFTPTKPERRSIDQCYQIVDGYLRLLVNSRDELSLSTVICEPVGLIDPQEFTVIKKEAKKLKMPLFQTIVSFVNKVELGGQSLANLRNHPFASFRKQLVDFFNIMDKLQTRLEEATNPKSAMTGILSVLRSQLLSKAKPIYVTEVIEKVPILYETLLNRESLKGSSNASNKSIGGGLVGLKNILALRLIVDYFATQSQTNRIPNIHVLLGKVEDQGTSPVLLLNTIALFKSPIVDKEFCTNEITLMRKELEEKTKDKPMKTGRPKFESTMAWATESSPILASPAPAVPGEKFCLDASPKLKHYEPDEELTQFQKIRQEAMKSLKIGSVTNKSLFPAPKRPILAEIGNRAKIPKMDTSLFQVDATAKENATEPQSKKLSDKKAEALAKKIENAAKKAENAAKKAADKSKTDKVKKSKAVSQIKGQSKITAFMRI